MTNNPSIDFAAAACAVGLEIKGAIVADGKIHRCEMAGDRKGKKNGWYVLFDEGIAAGAFGSWRTGETHTWCAKSSNELTPEERTANKKRMDDARTLREAELEKLRADARERAVRLLGKSSITVDANHAYIKKKGIVPYCAFQLRQSIVIPVQDINENVHSLQFIQTDGSKQFLTGGRKKGCFYHIGDALMGTTLYVAEGWATACSIRKASGEWVFITFDAGNLKPVCLTLRERFPDHNIVLCADDDYKTKGNPGMTKAREAAKAVGAKLAIPDFGKDRPDGATDFNDLHQHAGLGVVRECLGRAEYLSDRAEEGGQENNVIPINKAKKRSRPKEKKPIDWGRFNRLVDEFVLIYGTDTCFDIGRRMVIKINHLRLAAGSEYVKMWLASDKRKMILPEQLVFDPTETCKPPCINLFDGFEMEPKEGNYSPIMDLIYHLCADSADHKDKVDEIVLWVIKWLALPLQKRGTKMRSALVFHGPQGAGKNLFFEIIAAIYGRYSIVVGQQQIEADFNEWSSQKLFVIGDEVVARQELFHQKNKLKAFITGETIQINPKGLPLRTEANHANVVFLSNEQQPLALEVGDRRYFVIYTPPARHDGLYKKVSDCIKSGGTEAFYHFLMQVDLGGFSAFDQPPMTDAKRDLIELGMRPSERFLREWVQGYLPLPLHACSAGQLFKVFKHWATLNGERFPPTQELFTKSIKKSIQMISRARGRPDFMIYKVIKVAYSNAAQKSERCWILEGDGPSENQTEGLWMASQIADFNNKIDEFTGKNWSDSR